MQLNACLIALLLGGAAHAAPQQPKLVMIELETHAISFRHSLPPTMTEPGGLFVPPDADKEWLELGLVPGDIVRYANGSAITDHFFVSDGVTTLDVIRNGKPLLIHIVVHGDTTLHNDLTDEQFKELVARASTNSLATALLRDGKPSGVRVTDMLMSIYTHIEPGDIVRTFDGVAIHTDAELVAAIQALKVGRTQVAIERENRPITITLERKAALDYTLIHALGHDRFELPRTLAEAISDNTDLLTQKIQSVPVARNGTVHGRKVFSVETDSLVAMLGLQNDDIVLDINGKPLDDMEQVFTAAFALAKERSITLHIERKGKPRELVYGITD